MLSDYWWGLDSLIVGDISVPRKRPRYTGYKVSVPCVFSIRVMPGGGLFGHELSRACFR